MISEEEARAKILETVRPLPPRQLSILEALDCFAAEDYFARVPLPTFDNSAMDGYAVVASDCRPGARLRVIGEQPAGVDRQLRVSANQAARIFTGAPMPAGANAVVMQEDVARNGDEIVLKVDVEPSEFVRRRGCDLAVGQKIVTAGERIRSGTVGLLASQGLTDISIGGRVRAAVLSGGDELVRPGEKLQPGQIYESNSALLQSLLKRSGAVVTSTQYCGDNAAELRHAFQSASKNELVIVSGGVSVGEHDLVQAALRSLGAKIDIWRVAIKPGKPFLFGRLDSKVSDSAGSPRRVRPVADETPTGPTGSPRDESVPLADKMPVPRDCVVFGLPGNPVSAFVTFLQFVRPAILKMMGAENLDLPRVPARLLGDLRNDSDRPHYIRGKLQNGSFAPAGRQESHALFGLSQSNAMLRVAVGDWLKTGEVVEVQIWD
jgi:molybdopterin molybdotransferase